MFTPVMHGAVTTDLFTRITGLRCLAYSLKPKPIQKFHCGGNVIQAATTNRCMSPGSERTQIERPNACWCWAQAEPQERKFLEVVPKYQPSTFTSVNITQMTQHRHGLTVAGVQRSKTPTQNDCLSIWPVSEVLCVKTQAWNFVHNASFQSLLRFERSYAKFGSAAVIVG
eukprot:c19339_g1_i2.p1 GENE.c19339_g1_i2~~c19339_g1_i2.p1  ORF type:complete len:170 (+),score=18.08 c19339_g1_i2:57-566(+)